MPVSSFIRREAKYLLEPAELFGRGYAQYVAMRSGNKTLLVELAALRFLGVGAPAKTLGSS